MGAKLNFQQWISIIGNIPKLEVIETSWSYGEPNDGIAELMSTKTNLKMIVLIKLWKQGYNNFKDRIDPEWQLKGEVIELMGAATFIHKKNNL